MKLLKAPHRNAGDGKPIEKETILSDISFNKYKFNVRPIPSNKNQILFITCFFEFGCETIGVTHCIPKILSDYENYYVIAVGWHGRHYLYKHLCDEFWELDERYQWLREHTSAFKHESKNLKMLEDNLKNLGKLYKGELMGNICLAAKCPICKYMWTAERKIMSCPNCQNIDIENSLLSESQKNKKLGVNVPNPSHSVVEMVKEILPDNPVGIFARGRKKYGRNLPAEFYVELIDELKSMGYNPVWMGEKQSILPCPVDNILDVSVMPEAQDLEFVLAIIAQCKFTIQFWTASTRLSSLVETPWILFESDDQIYGLGHEGRRIALTTDYNKKKIVLCHYKTSLEEQSEVLKLVRQAVHEINKDNWDDIIGLIEHPEQIPTRMKQKNIWGV
jgi:hypothetical protein